MDIQKKYRIAQVVGDATTGGVISCVLNFYRNIDREKFQFDFYTYGPSPFDDEIKSLGGEIYHIPIVLNFFKAVRVMKNYFDKRDYYALHVHMTSLSFVSLLAGKLSGIDYRICHAHSTSHKSEKVYIVKNTLKYFSKLFPTHLAGCSRLSCCWLYGKKKGNEAFLLHNAIDSSRFKRNRQMSIDMRKKYGIEGKYVIGNIGRFVFQKNIPFLIDVFAKLCLSEDDVQLILVGNGKEEDIIEKKIESYGIKDKILILPETKTVEEYFSLFDIFVLPSRFEGLPLVGIEAQGMGIKCLLSDCITNETNISNNCEFLPIDNTSIWVDKIKQIKKENKFYESENLLIDSGYEIKNEAKRLEEFYINLENRGAK